MGLEAVGKTLSDAQALAIVNKSKDVFERLDDAGDAYFCNQMAQWRDDKPDVYEAFWWWRKTHEDAAKKQNEGEGEDHRIKGRAVSFSQYLAAPFSDDWEDDRQHLKSGVVPWITEERIAEGLDHKAIKRWLWAWHGRDVYTPKDEVEDRNGNVKAGERKFLHVHVVLDVPNGQYVDVIARWFGIPEHMVKVLRGRGAFLDMVGKLMAPVVDATEKVTAAHDTKVSELEDLPDEFANYGSVLDYAPGTLDEPEPSVQFPSCPPELTYYATPRDLPGYPSLAKQARGRLRNESKRATGVAVDPTDEEIDALIAKLCRLPNWFTGGQVDLLWETIWPLPGRNVEPPARVFVSPSVSDDADDLNDPNDFFVDDWRVTAYVIV